MDSNNDVDFDAYWEEESRNKYRNRIRVGRQYQASVPPLLRPGESDDRQLEDLETQYWKPSLDDEAIHEYLSMAKAVSVFSCSLESQSHDNLQSAIRGLTEFVMKHHDPCHRDAGCRMSVKSSWTNKEAELLACALERCENANRKKMAEEYDESGSDDADGVDETSDIEADCQPSSTSALELPIDVNPPSEIKPVPARVIGRKTDSPVSDSGSPTGPAQATGTAAGGATPVSAKSRADGANTSQQLQDPSAAGQGSLKFYLKGQLILKLNAHQERKTWVEDPDNPAASSGQFGGVAGALSGGQNRRKAGRKANRSSTTSGPISWLDRGSPSLESTSSLDSHNSTSTSATTPTCAAATPTPSTTAATSTAATNALPAGGNNGGGGGGSSSSSSSSCSSSSSSAASSAANPVSQQPAPLDLSSQQS
ncbi:uncharacterized protein DDB_G0271670-like [Galendromus occidentalis]|uniref:Uncharacterized protein DDB_G0271670-like n=1 Tax=Galendromus occidentalis TaxID=34638 RepID=A0AAJ7PA34_9ACAR|nr:uncharacterized protein DDB_G0271670-like [Galendromus occidentalis]